MPRAARASVGGLWSHALNRGNRRGAVFHKPDDYDAFVKAMIDVRAHVPVGLLGYCLMPNDSHLALCPHHDGEIGRFMQWLLTAHARRYHRHHGATGHRVVDAGDGDPVGPGVLPATASADAEGAVIRALCSECQ
jgi:putative transposase